MLLKPVHLILILVWLSLLLVIPASVYWSDSGEFIVAAYYLDIAHPAGFPLYSQVSNLFALLPFGSIAFRVNAFSSFMACLCLALCYRLTWRILVSWLSIGKPIAYALSSVAVIVPLCSLAFLRQSLSAEVYILNAVILLILLSLYESWLRAQDLRFLICASFVAGIGLGNHVSSALSILPVLLLIFIDFKRTKKVIFPSLLAGLIGLSVYAYIPIRAWASPPLSTGAPVSPNRFWNLVSDARDRALRVSAASDSPSSVVNADLAKTFNEIGLVAVLLGFLGLVLLICMNWRLGIAAVAVGLGNWCFFQGWYPDPWIPFFCMLGLGVSLVLAFSFKALPRPLFSLCAILSPLLIGYIGYNQGSIPLAQALSRLDAPAEYGRALLQPLPKNSILVGENSWFLLRYLRDIEKYRDDITLVYQPALLFPAFFEKIALVKNGTPIFSSWENKTDRELADNSPHYGLFAEFLTQVAAHSVISIEPNVMVNSFLKSVARADFNGSVLIQAGMQANLDLDYANSIAKRLEILTAAMIVQPELIRNETRSFLEIVLPNIGDLLDQLSGLDQAVELLEDVCLEGPAKVCSGVSLHNLALYYLRLGRAQESIKVSIYALRNPLGNKPPLRQVLHQALRTLDDASRARLLASLTKEEVAAWQIR